MIKDGPCGMKGGTRGENVYTYKEGETVQVELVEYIPHPGYFRIAFDDDGDDDFVTPASIKPVDPARMCPFNDLDKCGESDFYNNDTVLPDMDNLYPHIKSDLGTKYMFDVKMPKVECDNCTLQILQVMEDTIHGAYNPDNEPNSGLPDVYFTCIDLVLEHDPKLDEEKPPSGGDPSKGSDSSGCSVSAGRSPAGTPAAVGAFVLGALALRRRRGKA